MYTIEFLIEKFAEHTIKAKEINEECIKNFKEENPDQPLPDHMLDDFSITEALHCMCREILNLRRK